MQLSAGQVVHVELQLIAIESMPSVIFVVAVVNYCQTDIKILKQNHSEIY